MITDETNKKLWDYPFQTLGGRTPAQLLASEGNKEYSFEDYVKGEYGQRLLGNLLPWLNFGKDDMNPALLDYWKARGVVKEMHRCDDFNRTWVAYYPVEAPDSGKKYPVWYLDHGKGRDFLDLEGWGIVQLAASRKFFVISAFEGNSEEIFLETLNHASAVYPLDMTRVYLGGHSFSGNCAGRISISCPERIAGLSMFGAKYYGADSTGEQLIRAQQYTIPRFDIHGTREKRCTLPYNVDTGIPPSPKAVPNVTPPGTGLVNGYQEQMLWRRINDCEGFDISDMKNIQETSDDPVEQKLGIPFHRTSTRNLGGVDHYIGDVENRNHDIVMRFIGVEGAPHYPSAYAGELAWDFLSRFSRDPDSGRIIVAGNNF